MNHTLFILGPTASGKHEVALDCAERTGAEIVSIDSMKVYREMNIGAAKPSAEALRRVRHHVIDICDPSEAYNAARFVQEARAAEQDILQRGRTPLYVGGTGLYYKALVYGIFEGPKADPELRARLEKIASEKSTEALHDELKQKDPEAAKRIHANDLKRLVRALEVYHKTGQTISSMQTHFDHPKGDPIVFCLRREKPDLDKRIHQRTEAMIFKGLVDEVRCLLSRPGGWSREARSGVGYKEIIDHLAGQISLEEAVELINRNTLRFTKRQMTWFRSFKEVRWIDAGPDDPASDLALKINNAHTTITG